MRCCGDVQDIAAGAHRRELEPPFRGGGGHVFEFEGDDARRRGRTRRPRRGLRRRRDSQGRQPGRSGCRCRAIACGRDSPCGERRWRTCGQVVRCPGRPCVAPGSTMLVMAARLRQHAFRSVAAMEVVRAFARSSGREQAQDARSANSAALRAPAWPMASVPTGTPAGICTIERSESRPVECLALDGHAQHGQHGVGGDHAGQVGCAAGAGDDHLRARARRPWSVLGHPLGRAMGRDDAAFVGRRRTRRGFRPHARMVSQSDLLPMITPTSGCF